MGFEGPKFCSYIPSDFCSVGGDVLFTFIFFIERTQIYVPNCKLQTL